MIVGLHHIALPVAGLDAGDRRDNRGIGLEATVARTVIARRRAGSWP